jgi:hypothetical protein
MLESSICAKAKGPAGYVLPLRLPAIGITGTGAGTGRTLSSLMLFTLVALEEHGEEDAWDEKIP